MIQSSRRGYYPYGKSDWIAAMKKVYANDGKVFAGHLQEKYPHLYEQGIWIFDDWDKGLRAARFDPEKMRERAGWDDVKIVEQIRAMHKKHLPLYAKYAIDNHGKVFKAALRQFGSWAKALVGSGVTKKPRIKKLCKGRLSILNALSDALELHTVKNMPQATVFGFVWVSWEAVQHGISRFVLKDSWRSSLYNIVQFNCGNRC